VIQAIDLNSKKMFMPIPYRLNDDSQVSDSWKELNKATKLQDDDDNEEGQNGVGDEHHGDGLSLYEEYRGFIENKKHIRTSPVKKDLMVCSLIKNDRWQSGVFILKVLQAWWFITNSKKMNSGNLYIITIVCQMTV